MYDITSTETSCSHDDEADVSSLDISVHQKKRRGSHYGTHEGTHIDTSRRTWTSMSVTMST